jgi:Na+/H+ antiporter NhaC
MASATDHIDHVRTQLPYALMAAVGALVLFLGVGFVL